MRDGVLIRIQWAVLGGVSLFFIGAFIFIALMRMNYPFDLEWLEGAMVDHARWILSGHPLYGPPSVYFAPFLYMPLYPYFAAILMKVLGVGFLPLRLLSFGAALGCLQGIYLLVRTETQSRIFGILSAGLFAASFRIGGAWLDLGRVDSLFLFFLLWGIYWARVAKRQPEIFMAALCLVLSFFTKQTALPVTAAVLVGIGLENRKKASILGGLFLIMSGSAYLIVNWMTDGWLYFYTFSVGTGVPFVKSVYWGFWRYDLFEHFWASALVLGLFLAQFRRNSERSTSLYFGLVAAGLVLCSWISRLHPGGWDNVLMPGYAALSILIGLGFYRWSELLKNLRFQIRREPVVKGAVSAGITLTLLLQFFLLRYEVLAQIPSQQARSDGERFLQYLRSIPGEVYLPGDGYVPSLAGKGTYAHWAGLFQVLRFPGNPPVKTKLIAELQEFFSAHPFSAAILPRSLEIPGLRENYPREELLAQGQPPFPLTGWLVRPETILFPSSAK